MAPCTKPPLSSLEDSELDNEGKALVLPPSERKLIIVKKNLLTFGYGHIAALYGLYLGITSAHWGTIILAYATFVSAAIGVTAGAHRLWTHRTYKAKLPLQIILIVMNSFAFQNTAITWIRDHRLHHKYSDTDADPHNATRGFFYSHVGWLLVKKNSLVRRKGRELDMRDVYGNPVLVFQNRYAIPFIGTICFLLPTIIPMYCWGESLNNAWHIALFRYIMNLHITFLVNSVAHLWGSKPYDKTISPVQSIPVSFAAFGEGFHNYHHVYPWDYRAAELGNNALNLTTKFIDFFALVGWAYDMKTVPEDMVRSRMARSGDGSNMWGDVEMEDEVRRGAVVLNKGG